MLSSATAMGRHHSSTNRTGVQAPALARLHRAAFSTNARHHAPLGALLWLCVCVCVSCCCALLAGCNLVLYTVCVLACYVLCFPKKKVMLIDRCSFLCCGRRQEWERLVSQGGVVVAWGMCVCVSCVCCFDRATSVGYASAQSQSGNPN